MTSGDLLADRRLSFALMLREQGDLDGALSVIEQALERAPGWAAARFARAETLAGLGRTEAAVAAYGAYLEAAPEDTMGAAARLALLGTGTAPALPEAYLRTLFDQYAPRYEESLLGNLGYRAPALLRAAVDALRQPVDGGETVLDLGCGTGLSGTAFRDRARWLEGVDLSPRMVAAAERKGLYDRLTVAELTTFLAAPPRRYALVVAADTLVYFGRLEPVFAAVATAAEPGGLFALTLQKSDGAPFALGSEQRYSHAPEHVTAAAVAAGLGVLRLEEASYRTEGGRPVPGLVVVLRRGV